MIPIFTAAAVHKLYLFNFSSIASFTNRSSHAAVVGVGVLSWIRKILSCVGFGVGTGLLFVGRAVGWGTVGLNVGFDVGLEVGPGVGRFSFGDGLGVGNSPQY